MSTVIAVYQVSNEGLLSGWVSDSSHSCVLPGVLDCIHEVNVVSLDVQTAILFNVVINFWFANLFTEYSFTIGHPEVWSNVARSHWVGVVRNLEPTELSAVLPSPLSHVVISHDFSVLQGNSVVLTKEHSLLNGVLLDDWKLLSKWCECNTCKNVALFSSSTVLDSESENVSNVKHEVSEIGILGDSKYLAKVVEVFSSLSLFLVFQDGFDSSGNTGDDCWAFFSASEG